LIILSLFDGIAGVRQALKELNIDCKYYASEIDKFAIQVATANHPDIKQIGDVKEVKDYSNIDLLIGGSPCQDLSIANKERKGLQGKRSGLFYEYLRILNETKPKYFILENVNSMAKVAKETITKELFNIEPIMINSALVSAQQRKRLYWVGKLVDGKYKQVKIEQPEDQKIYLKDVIEENVDTKGIFFNKPNRIGQINKGCQGDRIYSVSGKSNCLTKVQKDSLIININQPFKRISKKGIVKKGIEKASCLTGGGNSGGNHSDMDLLEFPSIVRRLSTTECCRLQGFPDDYVSMVSNTQGYKALGNSFTVPVIKHLIKSIKQCQK
tara:strand:+ start:9 stop:986 length:978 start_codon:yes stop_codon:yes gene_type:complete